MNRILSGTGWGEIPEKEIDIPFFMTTEYRRRERHIAEAEEARAAAAVGRERRKLRSAERKKREFRVGFAVVASIYIVLILAEKLASLL